MYKSYDGDRVYASVYSNSDIGLGFGIGLQRGHYDKEREFWINGTFLWWNFDVLIVFGFNKEARKKGAEEEKKAYDAYEETVKRIIKDIENGDYDEQLGIKKRRYRLHKMRVTQSLNLKSAAMRCLTPNANYVGGSDA